jgi:hypothetical protein
MCISCNLTGRVECGQTPLPKLYWGMLKTYTIVGNNECGQMGERCRAQTKQSGNPNALVVRYDTGGVNSVPQYFIDT